MTFKVEPRTLRACASSLREDLAAARTAKTYTTKHGALSWHDKGIIRTALNGHSTFVVSVDKQLQRLADLLDASATELDRAADFYYHTDQAAATRGDSTYPPTARPAIKVRGD